MKVFISYSTPDLKIVRQLASALSPKVEIFFWADSNIPGADAWQTIHSWIDATDLVLVVITDHTISRAFSVGQEVGRARAKGKTVVPLVAQSIDSNALGCLGGISHIRIAEDNLEEVLQQVQGSIVRKERQLVEERWKLGIVLAVCCLIRLYLPDEEA